MKQKFLTKEDVAALKAAKKVMRKIQRKFDKLNDTRRRLDLVDPVNRTAENGKKWKAATEELYNVWDEAEFAGISTVDCFEPVKDYLLLMYEH